jgi:methionyl-tRNA formyltransferase
MQRAIMAGERETGVTVMYMDEGLDTGDILSTTRFPIGPADDLCVVEATSARLGGAALLEALSLLEAGKALGCHYIKVVLVLEVLHGIELCLAEEVNIGDDLCAAALDGTIPLDLVVGYCNLIVHVSNRVS